MFLRLKSGRSKSRNFKLKRRPFALIVYLVVTSNSCAIRIVKTHLDQNEYKCYDN